MNLTTREFSYLGFYLEGFFFGLYSGIFAIYSRCYASQKAADNLKGQQFLFYALSTLYVLSCTTLILDIALILVIDNIKILYHLAIIEAAVFACCDFIAQFILIYRCWIVWYHNISVVVIPSILAFVFLVLWIASGTAPPTSFVQGQLSIAVWGDTLLVTGLAVSMTVNALVTGLIVLRISRVFRKVKTTADDRILGITSGSALRRALFTIIESGMALFAIQLIRLVITILVDVNASSYDSYGLIASSCIHEMLNGITPTVILVRASMGSSFQHENSMLEAAESLRFNVNPDWETGSAISFANQASTRRDSDDIDIGFSNDLDIQMVER